MSVRALHPVALAAALVFGMVAPAAAQPSGPDPVSVIVVFADDERDAGGLAHRLGREHDFTPRHVYGTALKGFAASVSTRALAALEKNPRVVAIEHETVERVGAETVPTGVDRIEVDKNPTVTTTGTGTKTVNLPVAVLDTGINAHADLNLAGGFSAAGGGYSDGDGHGTHVAGTIAARDNGSGVVGVAPGAPLWSVRVCKNGNMCLSGDIVAGIDWVAARKADANAGRSGGIPFVAANFSITSADSSNGCSSPANATHRAICGLVAHGTLFVMAAGNDARAKTAYPVGFTVAAIADFDGRAGGTGAQTCRTDVDDTLADFSNWGVDIAAPGACILSTWKDGGYHTISGTSMATPHVTGAVALYLHANSKTAARDVDGARAVETAIVNAALQPSDACGYTNERGSAERLLFANASAFGGDGACDTGTSGGGGEEPPPPSATTMTVTLTGSASTHGKNAWRATATGTVVDDLGAPVPNATVSGAWSSGGSALGSGACTTGTAGTCSVTLNRISNAIDSVTFTVTGVDHTSLLWDGGPAVVTIPR